MAKLSEIMTGSVFQTTPETTVTEVCKAMEKGRFGSAVVMQGAWVAGIFTERDVVRVAAAGADPQTAAISEWMTKDPVTVTPGADSEEATHIMVSQGFRHLPIVDGKEVVGIVSLRDLLAARVRKPS
jgi:CBS domain-containing protein